MIFPRLPEVQTWCFKYGKAPLVSDLKDGIPVFLVKNFYRGVLDQKGRKFPKILKNPQFCQKVATSAPKSDHYSIFRFSGSLYVPLGWFSSSCTTWYLPITTIYRNFWVISQIAQLFTFATQVSLISCCGPLRCFNPWFRCPIGPYRCHKGSGTPD